MSEEVELRLAGIAEAGEIAAISRDLIEHGHPWNWTPRRVAGAMRDPDTEVIVARRGGRIAGFALMKLQLDEAHLLLLGVEKREQRRGIGRRLLDWLEAIARTAGVAAIYLEVRATNAQGRAFYRSLGYVELSVRRRYYSGVEDAVVMAKSFRSSAPAEFRSR